MGMSADGQNVFVLFNGPTDGDVYAAVSHDAGASWTQTRVTNDDRYHYDYGINVLPSGRVISTQFSITYSGPGAAAQGPVKVHIYALDPNATTWTDTVVDTLELGSPCTSAGCYPEFYDSGPVAAQDTNGDLVLVYSGAATPGGPRTMYARSSTDGGRTWSARTVISSSGANAAFAAAVGSGNDGARVWFGEQRNGRWNVWYRTTTTLGSTWSTAVKISDATSGTAYKDANGFLEMYGDYGEIAVTNTGKTFAVWAEGSSYDGPGGVWYNRQT
jgi:Neuraminidase (sialidase)